MFKAFENYKNQLEGKSVSVETKIESDLNKPEQKKDPEIKEQVNNAVTKDSTGLVFRVQIETSDKQISKTSARFKGLEMFEYQENKLFKYCTGLFQNDLQAAKNYKIELIEKGYNNAFVVAFLNGERISIEKAIKLAEK